MNGSGPDQLGGHISRRHEARNGSRALDLILRCHVRSDGYAGIDEGDPWRLGAIAHIRRGRHVALVRKASERRPDYEFGDLWALPGGMLRGTSGANAGTIIDASLASRVHAEAGIRLPECTDLGFACQLGPLVSSYTTATGTKQTVILVKCYHDRGAGDLFSSDSSISEVGWTLSPPDWSTLAPANLLAMAHLSWQEMNPDQRNSAVPFIEDALARCSGWSSRIGVPSPAPPWADETDLASWTSSWSRIG